MAPLTLHPLWPMVMPFITIHRYDRDGGHYHPRHRIEFSNPPEKLRAQFLSIRVPCCRCASLIHPLRARESGGGIYVSVACQTNPGCSRGKAAAEAYEHIVELCQGNGTAADDQPGLFDDDDR